MKKSAKLAIRASEIRTEANKLEATEANAEKRRQLMGELETVEKEFREALTAEEAEQRSTPDPDGLTPEEREFRVVTSRASLGRLVDAVIDHRDIDGAEAEMQRHLGMASNQMPLDLLETRAVTPAPGKRGSEPIRPSVSNFCNSLRLCTYRDHRLYASANAPSNSARPTGLSSPAASSRE